MCFWGRAFAKRRHLPQPGSVARWKTIESAKAIGETESIVLHVVLQINAPPKYAVGCPDECPYFETGSVNVLAYDGFCYNPGTRR